MDKLEALNRLLERLSEESAPIIAEGKRDAEALRSMGYRGNIFTLSQHHDVVEEIAAKYERCIILTDYDRKGRYLNYKLRNLFLNECVAVDPYYRRELRRITGVNCIEHLPTIINNLVGETYGKNVYRRRQIPDKGRN